MSSFIFDLQRFAQVTISAGRTRKFDGVTYTALDGDATLNLDDDGKVSGLASGKVQATVTGATNSPKVTFDASDGAITFTATSDGEVISITPFPIEFISGEFTYKSGRLDITAGSDLALVTKRGDFILRNQNHFVTDSAYIFSSTSLTSESEHVISDFSLTNGDDVRELHLEQFGTVINHFDQQGFTLVKGSSEVLNIGDYKLTATAKDKDAGLNMDLGEDGLTFVPNTGDGTLTVALSRNGNEIISGELECTSGKITFGYDHAVTFEQGTSFSFKWNNYVSTITALDDATTAIELTNDGKITFTPGENDGGLALVLTKDGKTVFGGTLNITDGSITFDSTTQKFSFTKGTKISLAMRDGSQEIDFEIADKDASFKIEADTSGNFKITPDEGDGSIDVTLKRGDKTVFKNNLSVNGSLIINPEKDLLTLTDGTIVNVTFDNYTLKATADGDAASKISFTEKGISITPQTDDDGKLKLTLGTKTGSGSMTAGIEILSGGFLFGSTGALTVTAGTELQIKFSDDYIINFKATDKAGGAISIGADGITFAPNSDEEDGGLQLTVKRGDDTRSASLDVTGSVTYKLDGSISLTKGTVVKNVFDSGNILTITANTDASGSILFNPQTGLTIKPTTTDALTVSLTTSDIEVVNITSIDGSITYQNGIVTATDGTKARITYYFGWKSDLYTKGGTASVQFTDDRTIYTANAGATFTVNYLDGTTTEIQHGSYADVYGETIEDYVELVSEGTTLKNNDSEVVFTLETAGSYTLNGMSVTTTSDNVEVQLVNDDTIIVNGISYTPQDENVKLTIDGDVATVSGGKVSMQMESFSQVSNFDTTDGSISYDSSTGKFSVKEGTKAYIENFSDQFVAKNDFDVKVEKNSNGTFTFSTDDSAAFAIERNGETIIGSTMTLDGSIIVNPTNNQITLPKGTLVTMTPGGNKILQLKALDDAGGELTLVDGGIHFAPNENDGALEFNFVNEGRKASLDVKGAFTYKGHGALLLENGTEGTFTWEDGNKLQLTSSGSTGAIGIDPDKGIKITSDDENLSMKFTSAAGYTMEVSEIKGSLWYKAGKVTLEEDTKLTAKGSIGGQAVDVTLEALDGDGYLEFGTTGITYGADTGKLKITYTLGTAESTFIVNEGSVFIGHDVFTIAEGSDLETDLKDFIPALNFTTSEAGTYTINNQTITTTAANLKLTATDDYMTFVSSDDVVTYDGMTFAGAGNVSLSSGGVVLGAGVEAAGFGKDKMFILAEAGNVTADARIFELTEEVPTGISVTGAQDGFIFSRTTTAESEARMGVDPPEIGKVFTEEFFLTNDDSYRIQTDLLGLQQIIGVSAPATMNANAIFDGEETYTIFDMVTDKEGTYTVVDKPYSISGDSDVAIKAHFEDGQASVTAFNDLNGTVSGDFTAHEVSINGSASAVQPIDDTNISITADENGFEVSGLDDGAILKVSAKDTYIVNGTTINANAGDFIVGVGESSAQLLAMNTTNNTVVTGTSGNDYIANQGTNVTINALGGNDIVVNYGASNVTVNAGDGNDKILNVAQVDAKGKVIASPDNVSISGGAGNDSIEISGDNVSVNAGAGSNQIKISGKNEVILLKGRTTVEGFNTGFGDGSDTIYINSENDPAGVEFLADGVTFGNDTASLTLSDVNGTAKVNLFHENRDVLNKGVFIGEGQWYKVEDGDFTVDSGEEVYFVGTASEQKAGIDFSDISSDLNVTMNTAYIDSEDYVEGTPFWVNGIYSLKGGAGNTTITGSKLDDTIISGSGATTINAAGGDDLISLTGGSALIKYAEGDGNDTIYGFNSNATLSPNSTYKTQVSGNDLIVTIGDSKITLIDAANLEFPNIASSSPIVQVVEAILKRTQAGYPVIAGLVFNPEEITGPEPTNYSAKEDWTITSADNLELYGVHYTPEKSNDKWVVLVHGYGCMYESMNPFATFYLANNYNVLMIDQRAAGKSEGTWLTMGVAESQDVALWTQEIASRYPDSKITLHGVSMGAATALLAAARSDTKNVTSIVEDCGYSDVLKTFDTIVSSHPELAALGISSEIIPLTDPVAESLTGYYLHDAAPIDSIATVKKPTLFISGDDDGVAPVSMLHELYDESGAEVKEKFIVKGAGHARAGLNDPVGYSNALFRFVAEANGEGWDTENIADNISLRGTKYNDTLVSTGDNVTIDSGEGDDYISNIGDTVSIASGEGNDTIYNHGDDITIDGGAGDDSISNNSDNVVFIWSGGNDTITGFKEDSVLSLGSDYSTQQSGDDVIVSVDDYKIVLKGASTLDNVDIMNTGVTINNVNSDSLISGTKINDSISNYGTNVTIQALGGDDTISNESENSIIDAGTGNDSISNYSPQGVLLADNVSINAGEGNDTIRNEHAYNVTLLGGAGNDKIIVVTGNQTYIDGGAGDDTILGETLEGESSTWAMGGYANINGGDGDDYIDPIFSDSASIMGGEGYDTIINEGNYSTLNGGADNDIISLHGASLEGNVIKYEAGDGNDTIYGFNETSKLSITAGTEYYTDVSGDDVLVYVGENTITIVGGASLSTINITNEETQALNISNTTNNTLITGTELADTVQNSGEGVTISGKAGDDSIISSGANVSIHGGAGNDSIENSGANATILGEYGDDKFSNTADNVLLSGSYGNDTITNSGSNVTISAGTGYNYTSNTGDNVLFNFGGGLDTIYGFNETSTLSVSSADYETLYGGKDIIVSVGNDIALLKNAFLTNDSININGKAIEVEDKVIYLMPGGDDVLIGRSNVSIVSGTGDDQISLTSGANNNVIQYAQGDGNDTIYGFNDTSEISISGSYSAVKSGDNVIFKVGNNSITVVDASSMIDEEIILTKKGSTTLDGKVFELTKNVSRGVTIASAEDGFTSGVTYSDGSIFVEKFIAKGDDSYNVQIGSKGLQTISGIDAGATVSTSATLDDEATENEVNIVTEDAGSYTFNDINITTTKDNAEIWLANDAFSFKATDVAEYDGKTFSGDGSVAVSVDSVVLGASISATGFDSGDSFVLAQKGSTTVDGRVFELTENIPDGMSITGANNDYTFSHIITQKEATLNNVPDSYIGKTFSENVIVAGDETYSLQADTLGFRRLRGISNGATVNGGDTSIDGDYNDKYAGGGQYFYVDTDTEGTFTIGEKAYSISGDSNVEIVADFLREKSYASGFASLDGTVSGDFTSDEFYVNGSKNPILIYGDDSIKVVGSSSGTELLDVSDGATLASLGGVSEVHTDTEGEFWLAADPVPFGVTVTGDDNVTFGFDDKGDLMTVDNLEGAIEFSKGTGGKLSINGIGIHTRGIDFSSIGAYENSLYIHDIERGTITAYEPEKVWLQMRGETMTLNGNELTLTADSDGIWLRNKEIVGLDEGASLQVSEGGTYIANETELKANSGDIIVGLDGDAYIYNADKQLITRKTPTANIINQFKPKNYTVASGAADITLGGGDLAVIENTSAQVNITAGDDTIVSQGENVHVTLTPEKNTWLFPLDGKMTLEGYDAATGSGFGTTYTDIFTPVANGSIDFNNGNLWFGSAQVTMDKNSELMNFFDRVGKQQKVGYASQGDSLDVSNETDDLLLVAKKNGTIKSGTGNDTILANGGNFIDSGAGHDLVKMTGEGNSNIVLNERTTVEGFHTGFGNGSDTVYINVEGDPAVDFKTNGLTFYDGGDIMTLSDVTDTAKVNLYYEELNRLRRAVFIAKNDWYEVSDSDLADNSGAGVNTELGIYFVGTSATKNHGIDFSGVKKDLNISMNTDYQSNTAEFWVNNVHSVKGGAGLTTIIGSDKNDTILAGTGETSINGGAGHDKMFGNTDADKKVATFFYTPGNGRDSIENFDFMTDAQDVTADKVKFDDNSAITDVFLRGDDVGIRVDGGKEFLMLEGAQGKSFRLNDDLIAKVDTNVEFDGFTNYYVGIGARASLTVGKGAGNIEVWLSDDSLDYHGTIYDGNFAVLDASQSDGSNILAGNELSNVIIGGSGENSLWGGYGSESDTLIGGAGQNTFFYGAGNGNDNVQNAHDGDIISLEDITLDQISDANITSGGVIFKFTDGGSLTVDGTADVTYQLADGSKYSANHTTHDWDSK